MHISKYLCILFTVFVHISYIVHTMSTIGSRLKSVRKSLNLNQEKFSKKLNIKREMLSRYENDKNQIPNQIVQNIHKKFNVNISWLLTGEGEMITGQSSQKESDPGEISNRFIESLAYLKEKGIVKSNAAVARSLNISTSLITEVSKGRTNIKSDKLLKYSQIYHINIDWLKTGKGNIILKKYNTTLFEDRNYLAEPGIDSYRNLNKEKEILTLKENLKDKEKIIESLNEIINMKNEIINNLKSELSNYKSEHNNKQAG